MARRRRGGRCEAERHTDAQRLLANADCPASVKQAILIVRRPPWQTAGLDLEESGAARPELGTDGAHAGRARPDGEAIRVLALRQAPWPGGQ
jgi:hypothetical protein